QRGIVPEPLGEEGAGGHLDGAFVQGLVFDQREAQLMLDVLDGEVEVGHGRREVPLSCARSERAVRAISTGRLPVLCRDGLRWIYVGHRHAPKRLFVVASVGVYPPLQELDEV